MQNNPIQMIKSFNEFRQSFNGDPEQEVKKLVASGKINQQQLNWKDGQMWGFASTRDDAEIMIDRIIERK